MHHKNIETSLIVKSILFHVICLCNLRDILWKFLGVKNMVVLCVFGKINPYDNKVLGILDVL